jgi:hypothetical protein
MSILVSDVPWSIPTPQQMGRKAEKQQAKKQGARLHPNSGALSIKNDFSTNEVITEYKNVNKTHTIKGVDLDKLFRSAIAQGKEGHYVVYFEEADITLEGELRRGR